MEQVRLVIDSNAGGVGKSTIASQLAYMLSVEGRTVALFDLDTSASLNVFTGLEPAERNNSIVKVFSQDFSGEWPLTPIWDTHAVDLCQGHKTLEQCSYEITGRTMREHILRGGLEEYPLNHDFVIFDCPGSRGLMNTNALASASHVLLIVQPEMKSIEGIAGMIEWFVVTSRSLRLDPQPKLMGLLPNMVNEKSQSAHRRAMDDLRAFGAQEQLKVFSGIRRSYEFANASEFGLPLRKFRPSHKANNDFKPVVQALLKEHKR